MGNSAFTHSTQRQSSGQTLAQSIRHLMAATVAAAGLLGGSAVLAQDMPKGNVADGARKNSMCIGCHGIPEYKTAFPVLYRVPFIAGQNEVYLYNALVAYKNGERSHPSMKAISASLSDQDMADLAAYYARLGKQ